MRIKMALTDQQLGGISSGFDLIGDMLKFGTNIWSQVEQNKQNKWTRDFAKEQFNYQKGLNERLFERKNNSVQRRQQT